LTFLTKVYKPVLISVDNGNSDLEKVDLVLEDDMVVINDKDIIIETGNIDIVVNYFQFIPIIIIFFKKSFKFYDDLLNILAHMY